MQIQGEEIQPTKLQTMKGLITEILLTNTAYDSMPLNSCVSSVDKEKTLFDSISILITEGFQQLLIWDSISSKWIWMFTLVDAIRLIMHALKSIRLHHKVDFTTFNLLAEAEHTLMPIIGHHEYCSNKAELCSGYLQQLQKLLTALKQERIGDVIAKIQNSKTNHQKEDGQGKSYVNLKAVGKDSKLSYIIMTMIVQRIHRILIEDSESGMIISIMNFKDILLYLLRIANESQIGFYHSFTMQTLLDTIKLRKLSLDDTQPIWKAFQELNQQRSMWICIVDHHSKQFKGMLFRQDFADIFRKWRLDYLWMTSGEYVSQKRQNHRGNIPEFRTFALDQCTRDIIWKIIMTKRNAIVCLDPKDNTVVASIGLLQLFSLYVN